MTENEAIDFLEDEINGLKEQRDGVIGEIAEKVFWEINGKERISTFRTIIGFITELKQYREIGTVEECREAVEKQKAKRPDYEGDGYADGYMVYDTWICPNCGKEYEVDYDDYKYCPNCGQAIKWDENMED